MKAVLRGCFYIARYGMFSRNVRIRFPFIAYAPVRIAGEGKVFIDRGCSVFYNKFHGLMIQTLSKDADVTIGKGCDLGGLTIRCASSVKVGERTTTAYSLIQDVFIVHAPDGRSGYTAEPVVYGRDIVIGSNVWLGGQSCVMQGSHIGDGSVLSVSSCILDSTKGDDCLLVGSPARRGLPIINLMKLKGAA